jgi:hypothetical protein
MKIRALISFAGDLTLAKGAVYDYANTEHAESLIAAGFAEEVKDGAVTPAPGDKPSKVEIMKRLDVLDVKYDKRATRDTLLKLLASAESDGTEPEDEPGDGTPT